MRKLARLLIEIRKLKPEICNLFEALLPKYFDVIVQATKVAAKYDETKEKFYSPTFANRS